MTLSPAAVAADGERIIKTTHRHRHQRLHRRHRRPIVTSTVISAWRAVWVCFLLSSFHRFAFRCTNARTRFRKSSPRKYDNIPSMHSINMIEHIDPSLASISRSIAKERTVITEIKQWRWIDFTRLRRSRIWFELLTVRTCQNYKSVSSHEFLHRGTT